MFKMSFVTISAFLTMNTQMLSLKLHEFHWAQTLREISKMRPSWRKPFKPYAKLLDLYAKKKLWSLETYYFSRELDFCSHFPKCARWRWLAWIIGEWIAKKLMIRDESFFFVKLSSKSPETQQQLLKTSRFWYLAYTVSIIFEYLRYRFSSLSKLSCGKTGSSSEH